MNKGILCTIDFSDASREVLRWSVGLAKKLNTHLTILHTYRLNKLNGEAVQLKRQLEAEARRKFGQLEEELIKGEGIAYEFKTEVGFVADGVERHVMKDSVSFLVMDKQLSAASKESFDELVEHLHVPLVIIP